MQENERLQLVGAAFGREGALEEYEQIKYGHINRTYRVRFKGVDYLLQCINTHVFKHPLAVMHNIDVVTEHIRHLNPDASPRTRLHFYHAADRNNYYIDDEGGFWRMCNYVADSVTVETVDDIRVLALAGEAFGGFMRKLSGVDASQLQETIPDFHNTRKRMQKLFADVEADPVGRVHEVLPEIQVVRDAYDFGCSLCDMIDRGEVPLRVTHNDTKTNNVLFDRETMQPLVVIDLDTIMPGLMAYDFGDTIRFSANTAAEDEKDLSKVSMDLERFRVFAEAFIAQTGDMMTDSELHSLLLGGPIMTLEVGLRFLDDYIEGDTYFAIAYPTHNLDRARCQLALYADMRRKLPEMERILHQIDAKRRAKGGD